jgi:hypothetical protein
MRLSTLVSEATAAAAPAGAAALLARPRAAAKASGLAPPAVLPAVAAVESAAAAVAAAVAAVVPAVVPAVVAPVVAAVVAAVVALAAWPGRRRSPEAARWAACRGTAAARAPVRHTARAQLSKVEAGRAQAASRRTHLSAAAVQLVTQEVELQLVRRRRLLPRASQTLDLLQRDVHGTAILRRGIGEVRAPRTLERAAWLRHGTHLRDGDVTLDSRGSFAWIYADSLQPRFVAPAKHQVVRTAPERASPL